VRASGAALVLGASDAAIVERVLEKGAEDFRLHLFPVVGRGFAQGDDFEVLQLDPRGLVEKAASEIGDAFEPPAGGGGRGIHGGEEADEEIVAVGRRADFIEQLGDEIFRQEVNVLGEKRDEDLQDETLGGGLGDAALAEFFEAVGKAVGGFAGDGDAIVFKTRRGLAGEEEIQRAVVRGEIGEGDGADGRIHLRLEVIDVEFVEVAEDDVARAAGDEAGPVVEGLAVVLREIHAALFHLDEDDGPPHVVGEAGAAAVFAGLANAALGFAADIERAGVAESLEEAVEEDLRLAFFVAGDVRGSPRGEGGQFVHAGIAHGSGGCEARRAVARLGAGNFSRQTDQSSLGFSLPAGGWRRRWRGRRGSWRA